MGIIIGLIGANIIAKTIGKQCIEYAEAKSEAASEAERIRANAQLEAERIRANAILEAERIKARSSVANNAMWASTEQRNTETMSRTLLGLAKAKVLGQEQPVRARKGFFSALFEEEYEDTQDYKYVETSNWAGYHQIVDNQREEPQVMFCMKCGSRVEPDAKFCKYCGYRI